jgi:fumarate hydratase class I
MTHPLKKAVLALIRRTSTDLPEDVEHALRQAAKSEEGAAAGVLETILENVAVARQEGVPICQDTGTPIFYALLPPGQSAYHLRMTIQENIAEATRLAYLRPMRSIP